MTADPTAFSKVLTRSPDAAPAGTTPDAVLFLVSQPYVQGRRLKALEAGLAAAAPVPCAVARMEGNGAGPMTALDQLVAGGARKILVQPVGIPFSDSLFAWLPGALAHWLRRCGRDDLRVALARDQIGDGALLAALARSAVARAGEAREIGPEAGSLDGAGWDEVPAYRHHLLVCSGPRCHFREAGPLRTVLAEELRRQGVARDCLVATTGCLFPCNNGPVVAHYPAGRWYRLHDAGAVSRFVSTVLRDGGTLPELIIHEVTQ
ncbi:(2Fe-2S) ferredoxin domain-containing protein [Pelagibacterium lacus]|uniref:(2Fe-2S) ferredoxin domain-containing protein n=1 Tax=Pelagibacterium lacus TaxID=2282655 RepID=A0A369W4T2_9HYPH|nr:(2Fe-2S) ferredoxin domain-containing protein [Pelagibacterium lacus]RDE09029.1 (2Fe-2S) ferredoxin domain-containing protein [Pelagibacterium lacus]